MADAPRRSRAWGVLAVSLALMALIAALSSSDGHGSLAADASRAHATAGRASASPRPVVHGQLVAPGGPLDHSNMVRRPPRASARKGQPDTPGSVRTVSHAARGAPGAGSLTGSVAPVTVAAPSASTPRSTTVAVVETAGTPAASARAAAPAGTAVARPVRGTGTSSSPTPTTAPAPPSVYPGHGSLSPASSSASFGAPGGGTVTAEATWDGPASLQLAISCPGGTSVSRVGGSGLSLELNDSQGSGSCTVTISLPNGVRTDVGYTLDVEPAP